MAILPIEGKSLQGILRGFAEAVLPDTRDAEALIARWGLATGHRQTYAEIARRLRETPQHARRIAHHAQERVADNIRRHPLGVRLRDAANRALASCLGCATADAFGKALQQAMGWETVPDETSLLVLQDLIGDSGLREGKLP